MLALIHSNDLQIKMFMKISQVKESPFFTISLTNAALKTDNVITVIARVTSSGPKRPARHYDSSERGMLKFWTFTIWSGHEKGNCMVTSLTGNCLLT